MCTVLSQLSFCGKCEQTISSLREGRARGRDFEPALNRNTRTSQTNIAWHRSHSDAVPRSSFLLPNFSFTSSHPRAATALSMATTQVRVLYAAGKSCLHSEQESHPVSSAHSTTFGLRATSSSYCLPYAILWHGCCSEGPPPGGTKVCAAR